MAQTNKALLAALLAIQKNIAIAIEEAGAGAVTLPETLEEINELDKEAAIELCNTLHLDIEGLKTSQVKAILAAARAVMDEGDLSDDEDNVLLLANAAGIATKKRDLDDVATDIREYIKGGQETEDEPADDDTDTDDASDDEEEVKPKGKKKVAVADDDDASDDSDDDDDKKSSDDDDDDEEEVKPKKGKKAADDDDDDDASDDDDDSDDKKEDAEDTDDGVDREDVAAKFKKLPKPDVMAKRLEAYNKAAKKAGDDQLNVKKLGVEKAYKQLVAFLVNSDGKVAEWGTAYIANGAAYSCGLELAQVETDSDKPTGKCLVTGKMWALDTSDNSFEEVEADE